MALPTVTFEARVAADPELRFSPSGTPVLTMSTVSNSRKRQDDGTWVDDKVCWLRVKAFKKVAENVAESIVKGDLVTVTGRLQTEEWEKDGEKKSMLVCIADTIGASLTFRTVPHGGGTTRSSAPPAEDPWTTPPPAAAGPGADPWAAPPAAPNADSEPPF